MWNPKDPQFKEYAAKIVPLIQELTWNPQQIGQVMRERYSQSTFCHLTAAQLEDLIDFLRSQLSSQS